MLPFSISLRAGAPIHEQVVYAVRRAVVTGQLRPGDPFPSVRALSTASAISSTVVAASRSGDSSARRAILERDAERLVIQASHAGISLKDLVAAIRRHWSGTLAHKD